MQSVLNFGAFSPRYHSGLVFSIFEGLLSGQSVKMVFSENPIDIKKQLEDLNLQNIKWTMSEPAVNTWEIHISKVVTPEKTDTCCGICGHSKV